MENLASQVEAVAEIIPRVAIVATANAIAILIVIATATAISGTIVVRFYKVALLVNLELIPIRTKTLKRINGYYVQHHARCSR